MTLMITAQVAALLALMMWPLTMAVSLRRVSLGKEQGDVAAVAFGDADDLTLKRRIRAFGNFVEYAPFCLVLLAVIELNGASPTWLWLSGGALVVGRTSHALGMLTSSRPTLRVVGMMLTYLSMLAPAAWVLIPALR